MTEMWHVSSLSCLLSAYGTSQSALGLDSFSPTSNNYVSENLEAVR